MIIKTAHNKALLRVEKDRHKKRMVGGIELITPTHFRPFEIHNVVQDAIVVALCDNAKELEVGDKVYGTHTMTTDERKVEIEGEALYRVDVTTDVYCKIKDGKIIPINNYCFASPMVEAAEGLEMERDEKIGQLFAKTKTGIIVDTDVKSSTKRALMKYPSEELMEMGIKEGDIVLYRKDCDYEMIIEGQTLFRIRTKDILAVDEPTEA